MIWNSSVQFSWVAQSCPTLCNPMNCSTPGLPVHHQLPEFTQTHIHRVSDSIHHLIHCRLLLLLPPIPPSIGRNEAETLVLWPCEELTHWERLWCWEGLGAGGEGDDRGWDGWMASLTRWTWVWVNSGSWWWTGSPGVLRFMGSQRVGHDWAIELTELN